LKTSDNPYTLNGEKAQRFLELNIYTSSLQTDDEFLEGEEAKEFVKGLLNNSDAIK